MFLTATYIVVDSIIIFYDDVIKTQNSTDGHIHI